MIKRSTYNPMPASRRGAMAKCWLGSLLIVLMAAPSAVCQLFTFHIVDSNSGRGIPLVEVTSLDGTTWVTDSGGVVAIDEASRLGRTLHFNFASYGYTGRNQTIHTAPGGSAQVAVNRSHRAERLYRVTGAGIYEDSVKAGISVPIANPLLNANVIGQDSVQTAIYKDKIFWIWGDTAYANGGYNFRAAGATSELPGQGGLDPSLGVNLNYFTASSGNAKQMMPLQGPGLVWLDGLFTVPDNNGQERMLAKFARVAGDFSLYEHGLALFNDTSEVFEKHLNYDLDAPIVPEGDTFPHSANGQEYVYFNQSYPNIRVKADWDHVNDISRWEAFTPLQENSRYSTESPPLDLDDQGNLIFGWKKNTDPFGREMLNELVARGHLNRNESPFRLKNYETGQNIDMQRSSVQWNEYRQSWIMIGQEIWGTSLIGEIWFAEAPTPEGPWENAVKVVTHHRDDVSPVTYSFYNPRLHPYFDQEGGRYIYFEGTYTSWLSTSDPTPLYDYNQIMYRLDLATIPNLFDRLPGDYNGNGVVDAADYVVWRDSLGSTTSLSADGSGNGVIDLDDYEAWRTNFGGMVATAQAVGIPEPSALMLSSIAFAMTLWKKHADFPTLLQKDENSCVGHLEVLH